MTWAARQKLFRLTPRSNDNGQPIPSIKLLVHPGKNLYQLHRKTPNFSRGEVVTALCCLARPLSPGALSPEL